MNYDVKSLLARIKQLEKEVESLNRHHHCCSLVAPVSPPPDNEIDNTNSSSDGRLQVILEHPQDAKPREPQTQTQVWHKLADQLLKDLPYSEQWPEQAERLKVSKIDLNAWIIAHICGSAQVPRQMCEQKPIAQVKEVLASAKIYARRTKTAGDNVNLFHQLQAFGELVFVSLCAVLEALEYPLSEINTAMREWLSNSSDHNLKRLRQGAIWANHTIANLKINNATEWVFNRALSISQYGVLSTSGLKATRYITTGFEQKTSLPPVSSSRQELSMSETDIQSPPANAHGDWTPLYIPAFIKIIIGDALELSQICTSLKYGDYDMEILTRLCDKYELIRRKASEPPGIEPRRGRKRQRTTNDGPVVNTHEVGQHQSGLDFYQSLPVAPAEAGHPRDSRTAVQNAGSAGDCSPSHSTRSAGSFEVTGTGHLGDPGAETDNTAKGREGSSQNAHCVIPGQELRTGLRNNTEGPILSDLGANDWRNCGSTVFEPIEFIPYRLEHFELNKGSNNLPPESFESNT